MRSHSRPSRTFGAIPIFRPRVLASRKPKSDLNRERGFQAEPGIRPCRFLGDLPDG